MNKGMKYEVETRVYFKSAAEAFQKLPFLKACLTKEVSFHTEIFSQALFERDHLLRIAQVKVNNQTRVFLGYKEPDIGKLVNVRNEIDEVMNDELKESFVLKNLLGHDVLANQHTIKQVLMDLGYQPFMTLIGNNQSGYSDEYHMDFKLMHCASLKYPLLLEIEKQAESLEEARLQEVELKQFIESFQLEERVIQEEPPKLNLCNKKRKD